MSRNQPNIPDHKLAELLSALPTLSEPPLVHISDEDFAGYATDTLVEADVARVDSHLAICSLCCAAMEELLVAAEALRDLDAKQEIAKIRQQASPLFLISSALSAAVDAELSSSVRGLLARWSQWMRSLKANSMTLSAWQPISATGFLAPPSRSVPEGSGTLETQNVDHLRRRMDIALRKPTDLIFVEVPEGPSIAIHITVKGRAKADSPLIVLIQQPGGSARIVEALPDPDLPMHSVEFLEVEPGDYFVGVSPEVE